MLPIEGLTITFHDVTNDEEAQFVTNSTGSISGLLNTGNWTVSGTLEERSFSIMKPQFVYRESLTEVVFLSDSPSSSSSYIQKESSATSYCLSLALTTLLCGISLAI